MKTHAPRLMVGTLLAACISSGVGCYPVYPRSNYGSAYNQDSKGYAVQQEPAPQQAPRYAVDPGLAIAGVAAAGLLGYAIGNNHHDHYYYGPRYYRPVPYGRGYYGRGYHR